MKDDERLVERKVDSRKVFSGKLLQVYSDTVTLPDGGKATREYISHYGAVCVVPVTEEGNVILERQYRYPMGRVILEIPAGKLDGPGENPLQAAKRELLEETGITADCWQELGDYITTPAYTQEIVTMFLASGLHYGERHLDEGEFLDVFEMPMEDLVEKILKGEIADGKTQAAVLKAYLIKKRNNGEIAE